MMYDLRKLSVFVVVVAFLAGSAAVTSFAQISKDDAHAEITFLPRSGTFTEGSEFDIPVYLNTEKNMVGVVDITIEFDPELLSVVKPSGGKSMFDHWIETPTYDNEKGSIRILGEVSNGIVTDSGLITIISFKALGTGEAVLTLKSKGGAFSHDGLKSSLKTTFGRATYTLVKKPSEGVAVFSETHPSSNIWYNNNNPIVSWVESPDSTGFSYEIDDIPTTIPDNDIESTGTTVSYNDLKNGVWYFHIKEKKASAWQNTSHYLLKIDTIPPVTFVPTVNSLVASVISRNVISFRTYDSLSGLDRYEVGVIDIKAASSEKPVFYEAESPYTLADDVSDTVQVVVRAYDKAGNVTEGALNINRELRVGLFIQNYGVVILGTLLGLMLLFLLYHYFFRHHLLRRMRYAAQSFDGDDVVMRVSDAEVIERPRIHEREMVRTESPHVIESEVAIPMAPIFATPPILEASVTPKAPIFTSHGPSYQAPALEVKSEAPAPKDTPYIEYSLKRPASLPQKLSRMPVSSVVRSLQPQTPTTYFQGEAVDFPEPILPKYSAVEPASLHEDPNQWPPNRVG